VNPPADNDAFWLGVVGLIVFISYLYNLHRSTQMYFNERSLRAVRALFVSVMLQIGLFRIMVGSFYRAYPDVWWLAFLQTVTAPILTVLLLSGGVVMMITWKADDRIRDRHSR
jgi:hypothetical protein